MKYKAQKNLQVDGNNIRRHCVHVHTMSSKPKIYRLKSSFCKTNNVTKINLVAKLTTKL